MNYMVILEIIVKIVAVIVTGYLIPKLRAYLAAKLEAEKMAELDRLIKAFVEAAEQTIHTSGADRKAYVVKQLETLNYEITSELDALIEAAVYGLKK